jgi:hypothetical protein
MWVPGFALALAAAVWFSAANFAVQFHKQRDTFMAAGEDRPMQEPERRVSTIHFREDKQSTQLN